jgi:hypothetical protein
VEPVKVPQNLELKDVLLWGLGAVDLACLAITGVVAWWLYLVVPGPMVARLAASAPVLASGLLIGLGRLGERSVREWALVVIAFARRPRRHVYRGEP